jgi:hypothetical protein
LYEEYTTSHLALLEGSCANRFRPQALDVPNNVGTAPLHNARVTKRTYSFVGMSPIITDRLCTSHFGSLLVTFWPNFYLALSSSLLRYQYNKFLKCTLLHLSYMNLLKNLFMSSSSEYNSLVIMSNMSNFPDEFISPIKYLHQESFLLDRTRFSTMAFTCLCQ